MFRLAWHLNALNQLTRIWTAADSATRQAITQATNRIDWELENDPVNAGESRPGGRRIMFTQPLGVLFHIDHATGTVTVLRVWLVRKRAKP